MIDDVHKDAEQRMVKTLHALQEELKKLRAGRAHPALLDQIHVSYYGADTPLRQLANVNAEDARTLLVAPFDKSSVAAIDKAIRESDLGLNPSTSGMVIRVPLPALTEQRRKELIRVVRSEGEACRVALRNVRRNANASLKELEKEKLISSDEATRGEAEIQKLTDRYVAETDSLLAAKEADLLDV
ncbi:ribosome recycling factor [Immundisolibacter sp.]|uniref:ribosome recycling factor n=2 Tax=Immundisolibacter sp. TaxID=1934948 RepID=UPI003564ED03